MFAPNPTPHRARRHAHARVRDVSIARADYLTKVLFEFSENLVRGSCIHRARATVSSLNLDGKVELP